MQSLEQAWLTLARNDRAVVNGGTCNGDSGGPHFNGNTETIVSIIVTGDRFCKATDKTCRLRRARRHLRGEASVAELAAPVSMSQAAVFTSTMRFASQEVRDVVMRSGLQAGTVQSYEKLAALLALKSER